MRLEQLEYFVSAVSLQSLNAVSEAFYISPQVVSKSIKQLEEELNTTLFIRSRKGLLLTEKGKDVYHYALEIVQDIHYLRQNYIHPNEKEQAFASNMAILTAKGLLPVFETLIENAITQRFPKMKLTLHTGHSYAIVENLVKKNDYDLVGIVYPEQAWQSLSQQAIKQNYDVYLLKEEALKMFMSRTSPFSRQKEISLKKLSSIPLIMYSTETDTLFNHHLTQNFQLSLKYSMYVDNISLCLDLIQKERGYALGLDYIFFTNLSPEQRARIVSVPLEINYRYYCMLLIKKTSVSQSTMQAFIEVMKSRLEATRLN